MYYAISDQLIITENMRYFRGHYFGWVVCLNICSYAHNAPIKMTLGIWVVKILTITPIYNVYRNNS